MERSFKKEVQALKLGDGETFHGEGILAVTKALLQSGVSYVGGYQGAPVSHVMDVLNDARDVLDELGVHVEANASEAGAAAMLGASINYPMRGAVAFKSTVGTNVASDALSNLASAGVKGGALIVLGEDYGEGSSIIQERSHAFAMKSQLWLLDPRPNLPKIVEMVEPEIAENTVPATTATTARRPGTCRIRRSTPSMTFTARPVWNSTSPISRKNGIGVREKLVTDATALRTTSIRPGSPPRYSSAPTRLIARKAKPAGTPTSRSAVSRPNRRKRVCHQIIACLPPAGLRAAPPTPPGRAHAPP